MGNDKRFINMKNLKEELKRMKSLFNSDRLYGNIINEATNPYTNSDGKIDLVSGKKTTMRVFVEIKNVDSLDKDEEIEIEAAYRDIWMAIARTGWDLISKNFVDFYFTSKGTGNQEISVLVDSANNIEEQEENNNSKSITRRRISNKS